VLRLPPSALLDKTVLALSAQRCVIRVGTEQARDPQLFAALQDLRRARFEICLDEPAELPAAPDEDAGLAEIIKLASIVGVAAKGRTRQDLAAMFQALHPYPCIFMAESIQITEGFLLCKKLGFDLFHGPFYLKPKLLVGYELPPSKLNKLQALKELSSEDYDIDRLAQILSLDSSLSYRLLRYINSSHFSLRHKIASIGQALTMLGQERLMKWLQVVALYELTSSPRARELTYLSVVRARFLDLLAQSVPAAPMKPDAMFLLGLFSLLDALLEQPMAELMDKVPLHGDLKQALLGQQNPLAPYLRLAVASDNGDWSGFCNMLAELNLDLRKVLGIHTEAMAWTNDILKMAE